LVFGLEFTVVLLDESLEFGDVVLEDPLFLDGCTGQFAFGLAQLMQDLDFVLELLYFCLEAFDYVLVFGGQFGDLNAMDMFSRFYDSLDLLGLLVLQVDSIILHPFLEFRELLPHFRLLLLEFVDFALERDLSIADNLDHILLAVVDLIELLLTIHQVFGDCCQFLLLLYQKFLRFSVDYPQLLQFVPSHLELLALLLEFARQVLDLSLLAFVEVGQAADLLLEEFSIEFV
jgi:hypothetical protein